MTFDEYQRASRKTAIYPNAGKNFIYPVLGIAGEAGEVAEKIKKFVRSQEETMDDETKSLIAKEIGDVLWYLAQLSTELGLSFDDVAKGNLEKLFSRLERGVLHGNGDTR